LEEGIQTQPGTELRDHDNCKLSHRHGQDQAQVPVNERGTFSERISKVMISDVCNFRMRVEKRE
jgi:hypothetical protein